MFINGEENQGESFILNPTENFMLVGTNFKPHFSHFANIGSTKFPETWYAKSMASSDDMYLIFTQQKLRTS